MSSACTVCVKDFFDLELSKHLSLFSCLFSSESSFTSELKSGSLNLAHQSLTGIAIPSCENELMVLVLGVEGNSSCFPDQELSLIMPTLFVNIEGYVLILEWLEAKQLATGVRHTQPSWRLPWISSIVATLVLTWSVRKTLSANASTKQAHPGSPIQQYCIKQSHHLLYMNVHW